MGTAFAVATTSSATLRALNYNASVDRLRREGGAHLGALATIGGSFGAVFTRVDCDPALGVPLYSQTDTFAAEPAGRWIRRDAMPRPDQQRIQRWQVLVAGAGQMSENNLFGRSIVADARLQSGYAGPDTLALSFEEPGGEQNLWTYAFLNTRLGLSALRSCAYGTSIPRLRPDLVAALPVPRGSDEQRLRVTSLVRRCVEHREKYLAELRAARQLVESLPEVRDAHAMCSERRARAVAWAGSLPTMVAWTYGAAGEALRYLRGRWPARVRDVLEPDGLFAGLRFARIPCDAPHGVDLLSQRDVFMIRRTPRRVRMPSFDARRLIAADDQLLVACDGQFTEGALFGQIEDARAGLVGLAVTQHILRLVPRPGLKAWLFAFFSTAVGHRLLQSTAVGTSVPMMRHDLVSDLPVPDPPAPLRARVDALVARAVDSRISADAAELEAIRIIEEEVLPAWLG